MTLFTKPGCDKCHYITDRFDVAALGIQVDILAPDNPEALAHLAWHELVEVAEKELPILVLDDSTHIAGAIKIKSYLSKAFGA